MRANLTATLVSFLLAASFAPAQSAVPPQYFGMHLIRSQPWPTLPFGSLRLWDTDTRWQQMNSASGTYDFSNLDAYLTLAKAHGASDIVLVLSATPEWISSDPGNGACDYASTAAGSCAPPSDLNGDGTGPNQAWRSFIYRLATHVSGLNASIYSEPTTYEMWNEFSRRTESWAGTDAQMTRMSQDAYCIIKGSGTITATGESCTAHNMNVAAVGIVPSATIGSPSAQASAPDVNTLGAYLASPGASSAADIIATHDYTYGSSCCAFAEAVIGHWTALRTVLPAEAAGFPVWSTEGSWGDTATKEPDPYLQSAYVARIYLLGWALGYKRVYWYAWGNSWGRLWSQSGINGCNDGGSGAGCTSQAALAYAETYSWMVGNTMTRLCAAALTVYTCELTRPDGTKTLAVWDTSQTCTSGVCTYSKYAVPTGYSAYLDLANVRHTVQGHTVRIGAKPILLLSGNTVIGSLRSVLHALRRSIHATKNRQAILAKRGVR